MGLNWRSLFPGKRRSSAEAPATPFRALGEATPAAWAAVIEADRAFARGLPDWLIEHMQLLRNDTHGFPIDRLEHCLQTATRAHRDGRDEEYVTCALFHDLGAALAPDDHAEFAAMILRPYIAEQNHWMLRHHALFQSYHYAHFTGGDRNVRERFRRHRHFQQTLDFCELYDQPAFDPAYRSMTLEDFRPMVRRVLSERRG
jgi:predicted HD phosphohydrolase